MIQYICSNCQSPSETLSSCSVCYSCADAPLVLCHICHSHSDFEKDGVARCREHMLRGSKSVDGYQTCDACFDDPTTRGSVSRQERWSWMKDRCVYPAHEYQIGGFKYNQMKEYFEKGDFEKPLPNLFFESDIILVMEQADCGRDDAINALMKNKGDIVYAIYGFDRLIIFS